LKHNTTDSIPAPWRIRALWAAMSALAIGFLLLSAAPAPAATVTNDRPFLFAFDGEGTTAGRFVLGFPFPAFPTTSAGINAVAVDYASGDVYVADDGAQAIDRFDSEGRAKDYPAGPAAGSSSLYGPKNKQEPFNSGNQSFWDLFSDLAVDNSAGSGGPGEGEQGRLYVSGDGGPIDAFRPNGEYLWSLAVPGACGIAVDGAGHLWVGGGPQEKALEFDTTGPGPASDTPIREIPVTVGNQMPCGLGVDRGGASLYVAPQWGLFGERGLYRYSIATGQLESVLTATPTKAIAIDQSQPGGHVFTVEDANIGTFDTKFKEYEPCTGSGCTDPLLGTYGGDLIGDGSGIAYNPTLDRVYVPDLYSETVKVFGARASGTVPDATIARTSEIARDAAKANGTINPHGVPNSYRFEWRRVTNAIQAIRLEAGGGTFTLSFEGEETPPLPYDAPVNRAEGVGSVQAALEAVAAPAPRPPPG
jgi:hypothetical protein